MQIQVRGCIERTGYATRDLSKAATMTPMTSTARAMRIFLSMVVVGLGVDYFRVKITGGPQGALLPSFQDTPSSLKWFASMKV